MKSLPQMGDASRLQQKRPFSANQWALIALVFLLGSPHLGFGILFYSTSDPSHNTTPPAGTLTNSGWQFEGLWGAFLGTPIAPKYFITAAHVGGAVGDIFHFSGADYPTTGMFRDPSSDLIIWSVCGTFSNYAALYPNGDEAGKAITVFGRGTQRGEEVTIAENSTNSLKGWQWGVADQRERWGTNVVSEIVSDNTLGDFLKCSFDADGGTEEAHLSVGDSGGGVFICDGGTWKLGGLNYAVDGPFNTSANGPGFNAAIFDERGLYIGGEGNWMLIPNFPTNVPSAFYSSRISSRLEWINSVLDDTPPSDPPPQLVSASNVLGPYLDTPAVVDTNAKTVTLPEPASTHFYRLLACEPSQITGISRSAGMLIINYQ